MLAKAAPEAAATVWGKAQRHVATRWGILKQQAEIKYDIENPFDLGTIDKDAHAATRARAAAPISTGLNMPAGGVTDAAETSLDASLDLYDSNV
jgi:hypothetical protein